MRYENGVGYYILNNLRTITAPDEINGQTSFCSRIKNNVEKKLLHVRIRVLIKTRVARC